MAVTPSPTPISQQSQQCDEAAAWSNSLTEPGLGTSLPCGQQPFPEKAYVSVPRWPVRAHTPAVSVAAAAPASGISMHLNHVVARNPNHTSVSQQGGTSLGGGQHDNSPRRCATSHQGPETAGPGVWCRRRHGLAPGPHGYLTTDGAARRRPGEGLEGAASPSWKADDDPE